MENSLVIWDEQKLPEGISQEVILWQSYVNRDNFSSVPVYLEQHAKRFKIKYLKFIHELGERKLKGKQIFFIRFKLKRRNKFIWIVKI